LADDGDNGPGTPSTPVGEKRPAASGDRAGAEVLKLRYDQVTEERDRIRQARAHFARQLGPLPAFAGLSVSVVAAFADNVNHEAWLWAALGVFIAMTVVSMLYSRMPAYRQLRARAEGDKQPLSEMTVEQWYATEIELEGKLYGEPRTSNKIRPPPVRNLGGDLQVQLDRERTGVFVTQSLFILLITCLVLAHLGP
jgi:hypothetical protein